MLTIQSGDILPFLHLIIIVQIHEQLKAAANEQKKSVNLTPDILRDIFCNIEVIQTFHEEALQALESIDIKDVKFVTKQKNEFVVRVFLPLVQKLRLYRPYAMNFNKATSTLKTLLESKGFANYLQVQLDIHWIF